MRTYDHQLAHGEPDNDDRQPECECCVAKLERVVGPDYTISTPRWCKVCRELRCARVYSYTDDAFGRFARACHRAGLVLTPCQCTACHERGDYVDENHECDACWNYRAKAHAQIAGAA